jgi:hypothetical protein
MALPPKILIVGGGVFGCKSNKPLSYKHTLYNGQWHIGTRPMPPTLPQNLDAE